MPAIAITAPHRTRTAASEGSRSRAVGRAAPIPQTAVPVLLMSRQLQFLQRCPGEVGTVRGYLMLRKPIQNIDTAACRGSILLKLLHWLLRCGHRQPCGHLFTWKPTMRVRCRLGHLRATSTQQPKNKARPSSVSSATAILFSHSCQLFGHTSSSDLQRLLAVRRP